MGSRNVLNSNLRSSNPHKIRYIIGTYFDTRWFLDPIFILWESIKKIFNKIFFQMVLSQPHFLYFVFSIQLTISKQIFYQKFPNDWILTADLWCRKRPLYQPSHNHCRLHKSLFLTFLHLVWILDVMIVLGVSEPARSALRSWSDRFWWWIRALDVETRIRWRIQPDFWLTGINTAKLILP